MNDFMPANSPGFLAMICRPWPGKKVNFILILLTIFHIHFRLDFEYITVYFDSGEASSPSFLAMVCKPWSRKKVRFISILSTIFNIPFCLSFEYILV